ncbi:hypothetical protein CU098_011043 [Rhizopus stolonifer]|uniref:SET domain-containing protein n=1 Tax=Rhizopus stolonifer TaxID=4846 RepID=A0A367KRM7_RHIST|nr:hypothetical protein CU098_011043 [Rhizopus stolonifer]
MSTTTEPHYPPVDTGLIRCICPSTEDDGFTIQCERCLVWQHAYCVHITHTNIPDHYLCDRCSQRKRPKLSKRIPISKKTLSQLDAADHIKSKKKRPVKCRIVSRYVHPIFKEARERWRSRMEQDHGLPLLYDHGPFVAMDITTLLTKGVLMNAPVSNQGLFATRPIPSLRYLMQVTGDVMLKSEFKFDPLNDFVILGTPLSHIMFYPMLDVCIDTRQFGNKARYIRRSCHPNAELRNVVLPHTEDKMVHLGLFARHLIDKGQEVTISWNWQRGHIAWKENMNWHYQHKHNQDTNQVIDEEEERRRKATIQTMLDRFEKEFGSCACVNKKRCLIEHLRRQCSIKEKPVLQMPALNGLSTKRVRRKSSVILLKPKPERKKVIPTITGSQENSDEELLDVEGDIDIGDELPGSSHPLPLIHPHESDAEVSSLSSLSSLSVFEDSEEDEEQQKRRKRIHHRSTKPPPPALLPRKKLWMRDYLSQHTAGQSKQEPKRQEEEDIDILKEDDAEMDPGELSDASTILLDEDELKKVYKKNTSEQHHLEASLDNVDNTKKPLVKKILLQEYLSNKQKEH